MARTLLENVSGSPVTVPAPYGVVMRPGKQEVLPDTNENVIALLGGLDAIAGVFKVGNLPDHAVATLTPADTPASADDLAAVAATVDAVEGTVDTLDTAVDAVSLRLKYTLAVVERVHMKRDLRGINLLFAPSEFDSQETLNEFGNTVKAMFLAHMFTNAGSITSDGEHRNVDFTGHGNLGGVPDATDLPTCIDLIAGLKAAIIAHGNQSGVHFNHDTSANGTAFTMPNDPPTTKAHCAADLNAIWLALWGHFDSASE